MTDDELAELRALVNEHPGPYGLHHYQTGTLVPIDKETAMQYGSYFGIGTSKEALNAIVQMQMLNSVPGLLARLKAAERTIGKVRYLAEHSGHHWEGMANLRAVLAAYDAAVAGEVTT